MSKGFSFHIIFGIVSLKIDTRIMKIELEYPKIVRVTIHLLTTTCVCMQSKDQLLACKIQIPGHLAILMNIIYNFYF